MMVPSEKAAPALGTVRTAQDWLGGMLVLRGAIICFSLFLICALWFGILGTIGVERQAQIDSIEQGNSNLTKAFEEHTTRTITSADVLVRLLKHGYEYGPQDLNLARLTHAGLLTGQALNLLSILDERGDMVYANQPFKSINLANRDYFKAHIARDTGELYIGTPLLAKSLGKWSIQITRRINKPDGSFGGVAVGMLDPYFFSSFYKQVRLGDKGLACLVGRDGVVRVCSIGNEVSFGQDLSQTELFKQFQTTYSGNLRGAGLIDDVSRLYSFRALKDYPLFVVVGTAESEVLAGFENRKVDYYWGATVVSAAILIFTALLLGMVSMQKKTSTALSAREQERDAAEQALQKRTRLMELLESLARAVNEAATPEQAMQACLDRICAHYDWQIGHLAVFSGGSPRNRISFWNLKDPERYAKFKEVTETLPAGPDMKGGFVNPMLTSQKPIWVMDLNEHPAFARTQILKEAGLRAGFAFPVLVQHESAAYLEFFSDKVVEPDSFLLERIAQVGAQLGRTIERKRAEDTLRRSEHYLAEGQRLTGTGSWAWEFPSGERFWSREMYRIYGYDPEQAQPSVDLFLQRVHPEDLPCAEQVIRDGIREKKDCELECRLVFPDGSVKYIRDVAHAILNSSGDLVEFVGITMDVTERKRAEQALGRSEAYLAEGQRLTHTGSWAWNAATKERFWSREMFRIYSYDPAITEPSTEHFLQRIHPDDQADVVEAIEKGVREKKDFELDLRIVLPDGLIKYVHDVAHAVVDDAGELVEFVGTTMDVTERKLAEERLAHMAQYDSLTGLPNRTLFRDRVTQAMARAGRDKCMLAIIFCDLDRFKEVNDTLGHQAGDQLLKEVAKRFKERVREMDTIARIGGDEFTLILEGVENAHAPAVVAQKILDAFLQPMVIQGRELFISPSMGISLYPVDAQDADSLLKTADIAMYKAKRHGRNNFQFYAHDLDQKSFDRLNMESQLWRALERKEFQLRYQPQVDIKSGRITGAEALICWQNPELGLLRPGQFIQLAEETGLIVPIGEWVIRTSCAQTKAWQEQGFPPLLMAVNLSPRQFGQKNLAETIAGILRETGLDSRCLELEITESMIMHHSDDTIATLESLNEMGVSLAIDDFGTGYSSLSYLKLFPVQKLKIDQSFVQDLKGDYNDTAIVSAIIALAGNLGLKTTAEGVETQEQLASLRALNCNEYQGYYFSRPVSAGLFTGMMKKAASNALARAPKLKLV